MIATTSRPGVLYGTRGPLGKRLTLRAGNYARSPAHGPVWRTGGPEREPGQAPVGRSGPEKAAGGGAGGAGQARTGSYESMVCEPLRTCRARRPAPGTGWLRVATVPAAPTRARPAPDPRRTRRSARGRG